MLALCSEYGRYVLSVVGGTKCGQFVIIVGDVYKVWAVCTKCGRLVLHMDGVY